MDMKTRTKLRSYIGERLSLKGDSAGFSDADSLFSSGRLDSLDAIETIVFLETEFGVDFAAQGFDQSRIDSVNAIITMVET